VAWRMVRVLYDQARARKVAFGSRTSLPTRPPRTGSMAGLCGAAERDCRTAGDCRHESILASSTNPLWSAKALRFAEIALPVTGPCGHPGGSSIEDPCAGLLSPDTIVREGMCSGERPGRPPCGRRWIMGRLIRGRRFRWRGRSRQEWAWVLAAALAPLALLGVAALFLFFNHIDLSGLCWQLPMAASWGFASIFLAILEDEDDESES
jgi:hypothetical protein